MATRPALADVAGRSSPRGSISTASGTQTKSRSEADKPLCSGNGIECRIVLAEPVIFLTGLDHDGTTRDSSSNAMGAILRGKMVITVTKSVKIKSITLNFKGRGETKWPEGNAFDSNELISIANLFLGIPPEKTKLSEEDSFRTSVKPYFNYAYPGAESSYGSQCRYTLRGDTSANSSTTNLTDLDSPASASPGGFNLPVIGNRSRASTLLSSKEQKRLSLSAAQSRSFQKGESPFGPTPAQKGYKVFHPGTYEYSFEEPIDNNSPETTNLPLASVSWYLEAMIQRAGTFKTNLTGKMEIPVVRSPSTDSLELFEPISINRKWEDQLHYEIMISGKSFPIGSKVPIAFKLTPLAKCQVHKIKVYISENVVYHACNKKVTRRDTTRKVLLLEKSAGKSLGKEYEESEVRVLRGGEPTPEQRAQRRETAARHRARDARMTGTEPDPLPQISENMLGDLDLGLEQFLGQTEMEMNVQIPTCEMMRKDITKKLVHDCSWKNVDVHHWIKVSIFHSIKLTRLIHFQIIMRISRLDTDDPAGKKRRHFEISIDSPISLLSCQATQANLALPEYSVPDMMSQTAQRVCGCPNAAMMETSPTSSLESVPQLPNSASSGNFGMDGESAQPDLARPAQAHLSMNAAVQRPIHMLRAPSFNPPAFDADEPPPPIATPPPQYDHVIGTPSHDGLADYFARLSDFEDHHSDTDDEDAIRASNRGRVNVVNPRTPGGRIARSMDIDRRTLNLQMPRAR